MAQLMRNQRPKRPKMKSGEPIPEEVWSLIERCWTSVIGDRPDMASVVTELTSWSQSEEAIVDEPTQLESVAKPVVFTSLASDDTDLDVINLIHGACSSPLIRDVILSVRGTLADRFLCAIQKVALNFHLKWTFA